MILACHKINKSFETLNKIFDVDGVKLTHEFLEMKLEEATLEDAFIDIIDTNTRENKIREEMQAKQKAVKVKLTLKERFGNPNKINNDKGGRK